MQIEIWAKVTQMIQQGAQPQSLTRISIAYSTGEPCADLRHTTLPIGASIGKARLVEA